MASAQISTKSKRPSKAGRHTPGLYRGIRLVKLGVPPRTPLAALREAVVAAVTKNADAIGRIK